MDEEPVVFRRFCLCGVGKGACKNPSAEVCTPLGAFEDEASAFVAARVGDEGSDEERLGERVMRGGGRVTVDWDARPKVMEAFVSVEERWRRTWGEGGEDDDDDDDGRIGDGGERGVVTEEREEEAKVEGNGREEDEKLLECSRDESGSSNVTD